jgi:hypothetical protein
MRYFINYPILLSHKLAHTLQQIAEKLVKIGENNQQIPELEHPHPLATYAYMVISGTIPNFIWLPLEFNAGNRCI